jgi:hypothetical protein
MRNTTVKHKTIWGMVAISALFLCYLLFRFLFFGLHGMKEWPFNLFVFGSAVIVIAAATYSRKVIACTVAGYLLGFAAGMMFHTHGVDQGGGGTNNAWIIWTVTHLCFICAGVIGEFWGRPKKQTNAN